MYKKVNEAISSQLDELRGILIESGLDEKKVNEAFQKFGEPKHTFYLVHSYIYDQHPAIKIESTYKNITRGQLPFCIMRDSNLGDAYGLFSQIIKTEKDNWEKFRKDEILKPLMDHIKSKKDWLDDNDIEPKYIERIYTKFHKPEDLLDIIKIVECDEPFGDGGGWDNYGIFREGDDSWEFVRNSAVFQLADCWG